MKLRKNPFTVRGHLRRCWLFMYRTPVEAATALLPEPLESVTFGGFAFWNVVVCEMTDVRPAPLPAACGLAYWHVAYRLHVRARGIEGLYFLRSDCDQRIVTAAGNWLTDFNFHTARITIRDEAVKVDGRIAVPGADARFRLNRSAEPQLADGSPFRDVETAAVSLKYKPFGVSVTPDGGLNIVRVVRDERLWKSRIVAVEEAHWEFFDGRDVRPELCCEVEPINYQWNRGEIMEAAR